MSSLVRIGPYFGPGHSCLAEVQRELDSETGGGVHIEPQYRQAPQMTRNQKFHAEFLSSAMWFWILWHFWHNPDAVLGHFPWPDASQWTDEELGIPTDEEE